MRSFLPAACCLAWLASGPAGAATTVIDDSGTLPQNAGLALHWQQPTPRGPNATLLVGTLALRVHLNVLPWLHRMGRIYLSLPMQQPGPLRVTWTTQGRLLPGTVSSGSRTLVYAGPITTPFIEDNVQFTVAVDGRRVLQTYRVNFQFEMDQN